MHAEMILDRLDGVINISSDRWKAKCPAHEDKKPSLSIVETDDGKVLMHCFAGCSTVYDILPSIGLSVSDLFPKRLEFSKSKKSKHWHMMKEAIRELITDSLIVAFLADEVAKNGLTEARIKQAFGLSAKIRRTANLLGLETKTKYANQKH